MFGEDTAALGQDICKHIRTRLHDMGRYVGIFTCHIRLSTTFYRFHSGAAPLEKPKTITITEADVEAALEEWRQEAEDAGHDDRL